MAHPYADKVKSGSAAKFKAITGKKSSGQAHPDEAQDKALIKKMLKQEDKGEFKVGGSVSTPRGDRRSRAQEMGKYARGGKAKKYAEGGASDNGTPPPPPPPPNNKNSGETDTKAGGYARGGKAKGKKGTTINIAIMAGGKKDDEGAQAAPTPVPVPVPARPPMAPPPGAGGAPGGMPGGGMPGAMQRGGKVKMTGGAETGVGRLEKVKAQKRG